MTVHLAELAGALEEIRPRLRGHAGDITVAEEQPGVLSVDFQGACDSCPAMAVTFAGLVRTKLLAVTGVEEVRAPQVHASGRSLNRIAAMLGATQVAPSHHQLPPT